jgi:hypothetical protein
MDKLHDPDCTGSDLLPLFIELREELNQNLSFKKQQLFKIVNNGNAHPDKFVAMTDIELLLLPQHQVRQRLLQIEDALSVREQNVSVWLERYFAAKYGLDKPLNDNFEADES